MYMHIYILYVDICINEKSKGNATLVARESSIPMRHVCFRMLAYAKAMQHQ